MDSHTQHFLDSIVNIGHYLSLLMMTSKITLKFEPVSNSVGINFTKFLSLIQ